MIAEGAARLARDHALADSLRESPALIPSFVEEVLRLSSPVRGSTTVSVRRSRGPKE
jgi:cytochrome P450